MTTTVAAPGGATRGDRSADVARARIAVMVDRYQVDVVVPTKFAVETFIDDLLVVLSGAIDDETVDFTPPAGQWTLARPGELPIPRWRSLTDHDVVDGTVLMLSVVESAEVFTPVVEDITDALAAFNERDFAEFDSETIATVGSVAFGIGSVAVAGLLGLSWIRSGSLLWCGLPALLLGGICWVAALAAGRGTILPRIQRGLELSSLPLLFAGGAMLVPPAYGHPGGFTAANVAAGAIVAAMAATVLLRVTKLGIAVLMSVVAVTGVLTVAGLVAAFSGASIEKVSGGVVFVGLVLLTSAPRLAVFAARIRPPDLPDPGNEVAPTTLTDIFETETVRGEVTDAGEAVGEDRDPHPGLGIERRARLAVTSLRGMVAAISILLAGSTVLVAAAAPGGVREIVLGVAVAGLLVMRARWYPDRVQAISLCVASAAATVGVGAVTVCAYGSDYARLAVATVVGVAATASWAAALLLPGRRLSPVTRRVIDLIEYALILVVPIIAFWIMGVYTAMRAI
ncbi:MAG: type VII secretion integral membrane protein EccD [Nocardia sp.]|nr:type VII secretion integral membrane protein EccD [Nocardia sp.]